MTTPDGLNFTSTIHNDTYSAISSTTASNLSGRAILITGAANGVGKATAISFARAGAAQIAVADIAPFGDVRKALLDAAASNGKAEPKVLCLKLDVTDSNETEAAAKKVQEEFGGLDVLINNAGMFHPYIPMLESSADSYWRTFEVNVGGTLNVTRYFLPLLLTKNGGLKTILNISSVGALKIGSGGAYRTTKLALLRWTECLNHDYAGQGLLAYCIHPGALMTDLGSQMPQDFHKMLTDKVELPADTMVWLCQERRQWLAGRYVSCCWDMPELVGREKEIVEEDKLKVRMVF